MAKNYYSVKLELANGRSVEDPSKRFGFGDRIYNLIEEGDPSLGTRNEDVAENNKQTLLRRTIGNINHQVREGKYPLSVELTMRVR